MNPYYNNMDSVVGERGQVTIPKPLRDSLGIRAGSRLEFTEEAGRLVARRLVERDPIDALVGALPPMDVDRALSESRGAAWNARLDEKHRGHRRR
jgi:antitoxin PrlF